MGNNIKKLLLLAAFTVAALMIVPLGGGHLYGQAALLPSPPSQKSVLRIAKKTLPAVVHIETASPPTPLLTSRYYPFLTPINLSLPATGNGTGILIDPAGHILTNAFLIQGTKKVRCYLFKGKWFEANIVGRDPKTDLAVLKINQNKPFPCVILGNSDTVASGAWVIALGHCVARKPTITTGIISAEHRKTILEPKGLQDFLQTDTRIDLVNTGGPLLDLQGKVIGINDALLTRIGKLQGIGFAIPWNIARHIAHQIIANGKVAHGWIGLRVQNVILRSKRAGHGYLKGVMVVDVMKNSPASKAGLEPGDIILAFQNTPLSSAHQLKRFISSAPIGATIHLEILRQGKRKVMHLRVAPETGKGSSPSALLENILGISVIPSPKEAEEGVVISWIDPDSPMRRAGFEAKDIITEANGRPIRTHTDLEQAIKSLPSERVIIFRAIDHRTHRPGYVQVPLK